MLGSGSSDYQQHVKQGTINSLVMFSEKLKSLSRVQLFIGVGSLSLISEDLPNPGIEPRSPTLQADSLAAEP